MQKFYRSDNRRICGDNDTEPKQRARRRQRERQKTIGLECQTSNTLFFVHFTAGLRRKNGFFHVLSGGSEHKTTIFFSFLEL